MRWGEEPIFQTPQGPVWILGKEFDALAEKDEVSSSVASRLWFTYRRNFPPIGPSGPTSDAGWGCMLRCGQMILAEALVRGRLGPDWRWVRGRDQTAEYASILDAFADKEDSCYSIHRIAQAGVGEGKAVGQWHGPNTVSQVLKRLAALDPSSRIAVHVAMDNAVVIEDVRRLCMPRLDQEGGGVFSHLHHHHPEGAGEPTHCVEEGEAAHDACVLDEKQEPAPCWKPLVLLIPVRLGLSGVNAAYVETLKRCFTLPQSLGVIGGKPNSARYFIGYACEEQLVCLDPHTTQLAAEPRQDGGGGRIPDDDTYHWQRPPCLVPVADMDPSIAAGFFCGTEDDFDDWCARVRGLSSCGADGGCLPVFELVDDPRVVAAVSADVLDLSDTDGLERFLDSEDEEFEIL